MDFKTTLIVLIPSVLSLITSGIYAYIALKKAKEPPKDEVWETALRLMCAGHSEYSAADDFVKTYRELKFFKDHPNETTRFLTLEETMTEYAKTSHPSRGLQPEKHQAEISQH